MKGEREKQASGVRAGGRGRAMSRTVILRGNGKSNLYLADDSGHATEKWAGKNRYMQSVNVQ